MEHAEILHRCFRCGYCKLPGNHVDINCPAYLKYRFETYAPSGRMWLLRAWLDGELRTSRRLQEILFSCASCGNCTEQCAFPKFKDRLLAAFTAGKTEMVLAGTVPPKVRDALTRAQTHGNPFGLSPKKRGGWAGDLDLSLFSGQKYLFWVGDAGAYDDRGQEVARAAADLLRRCGVDFGIFGSREVSDGNDVRSMGEADLFAFLAEKNIDALRKAGVAKIVCLSPHGYNAFKNDYPLLGGEFEVSHYTELVSARAASLNWAPDHPPATVCFHDPCYLGRHNREYQSARSLLGAMPGIRLVEMDRNRHNALCCGGGGGNFFTDFLGGGPDSPARVRVREAVETGATILATACPKCTKMLAEAVKDEGVESSLTVREVSEIALDRLG